MMRALLVALAIALPGTGWAQSMTQIEVPARTPKATLTLGAELYRPAGEGPRAAVVVMHGCGGLATTHRTWGKVLSEKGYVVLVLDSFGGRNVKEVCTGKQNVEARERAWDADAAVQWLGTQPFVKADRIAIQGHSHGGAAVLFAAFLEEGDRTPTPPPRFKAVTAFYPDCTLRGRTAKKFTVRVPLQILVGEADDWTPADKCHDLMPRLSGAPASLTTYPGAYHSFDGVSIKPRYREDVRNRNKPGGCCGAWIGFNEPAYRDSVARVEAFLLTHLGGP
ncbi:MAG: dienelactone hydrolase family protein [Alphaproteobacteria bacterium]|nr:dienelactone hydrolase family protein [Alphaproteobacteria bacterium]